jgi:hypothetical protein
MKRLAFAAMLALAVPAMGQLPSQSRSILVAPPTHEFGPPPLALGWPSPLALSMRPDGTINGTWSRDADYIYGTYWNPWFLRMESCVWDAKSLRFISGRLAP